MNQKKVAFIVAFIIASGLGVLLGLMIIHYFGGDGIETNKEYALAYSYKAPIKGGGEARVFDFADRNLPRASITAPLRDDRGMPLVRENRNLPPNTVRKVVGKVPTSVMEGVTYPGYTYTLWEYHLGVKEPQSVVPEIVPARK